MKFKEMYIPVNKKNINIVCDILEANGFKKGLRFCENEKYISTYQRGEYGTYTCCLISNQFISFKEFMKKYGTTQ